MTTPAGSLAKAFGDIPAMRTMYTDDIVWALPRSLGPVAGPYVGKPAVIAFNERVWNSFYYPDVTIEILDEAGDENHSAVRFIYNARLRSNDADYSLEYSIFAQSRDGLIHDVFEFLDTLGSANLFAEKPLDLNPYRG